MGLTLSHGLKLGGISLQNGALLNQTVDETLLADGNYLVTEEGYLIVETDNIESFLISED